MHYFKYLFLFIIISTAFPRKKNDNLLPKGMPYHTKLLWGENGLFRKIKLAPESRDKELMLRLKMLQLHQKIALGSLGAFYYQAYLGNELVKGNYEHKEMHSKLSKMVWGSYMVSASLSYLAPPALIYNQKISSMKIHKLLSYVHFFGMAAIPYLGYRISVSDDYNKALELHQNVAYTTLFTLSLSALLTFLPY